MAKKYLPLALVLLLLTGSCTTKIAYNYAHWWANWAVDDYIDLNREQKAFFKREFRQLHQWHRQTQLPIYTTYLQQLQTALSAETVTPEMLHQQAIEMQGLIDNSKREVVPALAQLLASLSAKQRSGLLQNLQTETEKYQKKNTHKTPEKSLKARQKSMGKFVKNWLGPLTKNQKEQIQQWSQQVQSTLDMDVRQQQLWQQKFSVALGASEQEEIATFLDRYLLDDSSLWQQDYRLRVTENRRLTRELLSNLLNSRTNKQRRKLNKKLHNLAEDFQQLAGKTATRQALANQP